MSAAPSLPSNHATAEAAQAGLLYERHASRLLRFCRSRLRSPEEAEDAVQHTFLNAYRSLRTGTVPRAETAWLFTIAHNVCLERQRSAWRRSRVEMVADDGLVGDRAAPEQSHDELAGMAAALAELTPNQRRAILLREWQGLSYREIAAELELTEAAVETLLFRARRSLARKLDRSRGSAWAWLDLGSALAGVKSLLGGTAAQVAAATLVVAAGVTASAPSPAGHAATSLPVVVRAVVPAAAHAEIVRRPAQHSAISSPSQARRKPAVVAARRARPTRPAGGRPARTAPQTEPVADPAPGAGSVPTQEPKAPSAPAPQLPPAPPPPAVQVPPPPSLPRLPALPPVPAVPPLPPVSLPQLPSVPLPVLPPLPKLP